MTKMNSLKNIFVILCTGCFLSACTGSPSGAPPDSDSDHTQVLLEKADRFAQSELARYNAVELIYKNIPELHTTRVPINNKLLQGWTKTYRRFTDYEVVDIVQSGSLLAPIQYEITFQYEQYNTSYRKTDEANAQELCEKDFQYTLRFTDSITRNFACDEKGIPLNSISEMPERPLYFKKEYLQETTSMPSLP